MTRRPLLYALLAVLAAPPTAGAQGRPDTVVLEELTWDELRDLQRGGTTTVILGTAGTEQKGPHMAMGEHKFVLRYTTERIARALGNAVVAPIITYVPEGSWEAPLRGHMAKAGTITLPQDRFVQLLLHAARSLRAGGFRHVVLIGDSGGNQDGMREAAATLNDEWRGSGARAHFIPDYYTKSVRDIHAYLEKLGHSSEAIGTHAGMIDTSELMFVNPSLVRRDKLAKGGGFPDSGVSGDPTRATPELGEALVRIKIDNALAQIRASIAGEGAEERP